MKRQSGILLHISSLPSSFGIGDCGPEAYRFVDFLKEAHQTCWQILPLNPTDAVNVHSPYSSFSAFGSNELFISPEWLLEHKFISRDQLNPKPKFSQRQVDFEKVIEYKRRILEEAYNNFINEEILQNEFEVFCRNNESWLNDFALFVVFKNMFKQQSWISWPSEIKFRHQETLLKYQAQNEQEINYVKFSQFIFDRQWHELKTYANQNGIHIIGDLPIYVNHDSVDVWENPKDFKLDEDFNLKVVAGVPPDDFSQTGQRWGNPVYDWDYMKTHQFDWWINRFKRNFDYFDYIRIDHFRGFINFWEIPVQGKALEGSWAEVPTDEFFNQLRQVFPEFPVIAEDLGMIDDEVREKIKDLGFPGMKILLFAFNGDLEYHPYLPHNYPENCVVYTGTHDNNTVMGWYQEEMSKHEKHNLTKYLKKKVNGKTVHWDLIELAFQSKANGAIVPIQDVLGLGSPARMNKPATMVENWNWRLLSRELKSIDTKKLADLTQQTNRGK